jgi:hypothetical protein
MFLDTTSRGLLQVSRWVSMILSISWATPVLPRAFHKQAHESGDICNAPIAADSGNSGCRSQREKRAAAGGPLLHDKQVEQRR